MWTPRTPEETAAWHAATAREARTNAVVVAGLCWIVVTVMLSGGWIAGGRMGIVAQDSVAAGNFWSRFPIIAVVGLPIAFWFFRRESRREVERLSRMTICPKCDTAGESNADVSCDCGGTFVLQSTVRWIDESELQGHQSGQ